MFPKIAQNQIKKGKDQIRCKGIIYDSGEILLQNL